MASLDSGERVLVVGAGGLGGITTALLWERWMAGKKADPASFHEAPIVALTTNRGIADSVREHGYRLGGLDVERSVRAPIVEKITDRTAPFDWIVLAVQPPQVEEAARDVLAHLAPQGKMVCFQNGLCEERVQRIAGNDRVVGAVVGWGGSMPQPGRYERTAAGGFTIGLPGGGRHECLDRLARLLDPIAPARVAENFAGARWSKLAVNCAISTLGTIGGTTLGAVLMQRVARRLALEIISEVVAVARAANVPLAKISGLDLEWLELSDEDRQAAGSPGLVAKHSLMLAAGARYRRMRSSMLAAIERGRIPAVDFLNGEIVDRGERYAVPTPVNREAQRLVHEIARRQVKPGIQSIHLLRDRALVPAISVGGGAA